MCSFPLTNTLLASNTEGDRPHLPSFSHHSSCSPISFILHASRRSGNLRKPKEISSSSIGEGFLEHPLHLLTHNLIFPSHMILALFCYSISHSIQSHQQSPLVFDQSFTSLVAITHHLLTISNPLGSFNVYFLKAAAAISHFASTTKSSSTNTSSTKTLKTSGLLLSYSTTIQHYYEC